MPDMKTLTMNGTAYTIMDETARNHIANTDNPHGTTAAQVGARPDTWMPTAAEVGARSDTWLPTISEIGAAPDGYGLGSMGVWVEDLNNATNNGFYSWTNTALNIPFDYGCLLVLNRSNTRITQIAIDPNMSYCGQMAVRHYSSTAWGDWQYINPPLNVGVEYRTIERWKGKTVYVCLVAYGSLPNATFKFVAHQLSATNIIRAHGTTTSGTYIPFSYNSLSADAGEQIELLVNKTNIVITTHADYSTATAHVTIWYTKD